MQLRHLFRLRSFAVTLAVFGLLMAGCSNDETATAPGENNTAESDTSGDQDDTGQSDDTGTAPDTTESPDTSEDDTGTAEDTSDQADTDEQTDTDTTAPVVTRFIAMGDTGEGNDAQKRVAEGAQKRCDEVGGCDGFIMLGDNIYDTGPESAEDEQFRTKIDQPYMNMKKGPVPTDNTLRERLPIYVSLGNHDLGGAGLENDLIQYYIDYGRERPWFYYPSEYWDKKVGNVHLMSIHTNPLAYLGSKYDEQGQMVEDVLANTDADWTIVFGHHPYRSDGQHGNAGSYEGIPGDLTVNGGEFRKWIDEFVCNRVDFYLSGHDHNRQWFNSVPDIPTWPIWEDDTRPCNSWFGLSGAGAKTRDMEDRDNDLAFGEPTLGFTLLEFYEDRVVVEMCDPDGNVEWTRTLTR